MLYNILMERSKKLEEENSSLVLENETYSRQYEKCIDEISKQVVQSLLTQKVILSPLPKLHLHTYSNISSGLDWLVFDALMLTSTKFLLAIVGVYIKLK